ncbi:retinol dehydrogenase 7-like [Scleropages formosus]|uniref:Retinol dehydrogenase 7-like n=1 Tax=Scleropages formosus TaxID=113540 RepID=A0A8C9S4B7_SCLFO|nr:retinol dehydrogenase 7-like [Scleropages formosus]
MSSCQAWRSSAAHSCVLVALVCVAALCLVSLVREALKIDGVRDKCVLVTGCDSGFGNHVARQLDRRGFQVIATCMTEKGCSDLEAAASPNLRTVLLNLTDGASLDRVVELVRSVTGARGLWGLVNNAGRSIPIGPTEWMQVEDFKKVLDVNLIGMIDITLRLLPLVKRARGRIVNVASVMGRVALTGGGYALSKWGVESFSDSLRRDMRAFGVKVSVIEPGFFKTAVTNVDLIEADLLRLWNRLPQDIKDSYGDKYLENYVKAQSFAMSILCSKDISKVTWCMEHALTSRYPRTRYGAGWDAKLVWLPLSYCPTFITDFVICALFPVPKDTRVVGPSQVDVSST